MSEDTEPEDQRHWATNDALAVLIVGSLLALVAATVTGHADLDTLPEEFQYAIVGGYVVVLAWLFGADKVKSWLSQK